MHAGRQLPNRLTIALLVAITTSALSGCASDRYLGKVGARSVYSNRGFGLVLDLSHGDLHERWTIVDVDALAEVAASDRPLLVDAPLDLDGDGVFAVEETTRHLRPTVRLLSRTSTRTEQHGVPARIDIDVAILGKDEAKRSVEDLTLLAARELLGKDALIGELRQRRVGPDFEAMVGEGQIGAAPFVLAVIDQRGFYATETQVTRRQAVRVLLIASSVDDALRQDFDTLLEAITLNQRGAPTTNQEEW